MNQLSNLKALTKTLILFLALLFFRVFEYFIIKTDRTFLAENFIHKVIGLIILFLVLRKINTTFSNLGFTRNFKDLLKGLFMGSCFFLISYFIEIMIQLNHHNHPRLMIYTSGFSMDNNVFMNTTMISFVLVILFNIINVLMEEGIFRGLFIKLLNKPYGFAVSNIIVAFLFGIWHWPMPYRSYLEGSMTFNNMLIMLIGYILMAGIMSIKWGLLYDMTHSLWFGLGDHLFNNLIATNLLHVVTDGGSDELMIVRILCAQLLSFLVVLYIYKVKFVTKTTK